MKKIYWGLLFCMMLLKMNGQIIHPQQSSKYIEAGVYSKHFTNAFSFTANQAILSSLEKITTGLFSEKRFLLPETGFSSLAISFPSHVGGFGIQLNYFGFADYNEMKAGIAYGKKLGETVDIGVQFNYNRIHISGYGNAGATGFEIGVMMHPSEKLDIGLHVCNPVGGKFGKNNHEKLASVYTIGIGYEASEQVLISLELIKEEEREVNINAVLQYIFARQFFGQIGILTASSSPYGGVGLSWKDFRVDISASYHLQLGFSPGLLLIFNPGSVKTH